MRAYRNDRDDWESVGTINMPEIGKIGTFKPDYFTYQCSWKSGEWPKRIRGQYTLGTATAEIGTLQSSSQFGYQLEMRFEKLEDGQELYTLIRSGKILPVVSYEGEQSGTVIRQFRDLVREFIVLCQVTLRRWQRVM